MSELDSLTPFQRMLLGTDGTVTHILEAYAGEPIEVVKLLQTFDRPNDGDALLELPEDATVLRRRVVLRGGRTKQNLLYADVAVAPDRISPALLDGLVRTDKPVGKLLAENRTETFREIVVIETEPAGSCSTYFGIDPTATVVSRTYRIFANAQPVMVITEKFPTNFFRSLQG